MLKNLQNLLWSNLICLTQLSKSELEILLPKICQDISEDKKQFSDYSKQLQLAVEIYSENIELLSL
jgi:hypothetical protein